MVERAHLTYTRTLEHPIDLAYAWLTDYDEEDPKRAGGIIQERTQIQKEDGKVVFQGRIKTVGRDARGHAEVHLDPPDHWTAHLYDQKERLGDIYDYRLEPLEGDRCRLVVDYGFAVPKFKHKLQIWVGKPLIRRKIDQMWDGFAEAMGAELSEDPAPEGEPQRVQG